MSETEQLLLVLLSAYVASSLVALAWMQFGKPARLAAIDKAIQQRQSQLEQDMVQRVRREKSAASCAGEPFVHVLQASTADEKKPNTVLG